MTRQNTSPATILPRLGFTLLLVAVFVGIIALAWMAGESAAQRLDRSMRAQLLNRAVDISRSINPELAVQLSFTAVDTAMPAFNQIRSQMIAMAAAGEQRGIYSLALRDGQIVFGPESYAESDPMASAPGTVYEQHSFEYLQALEASTPATIGPYTDEYGIFVSALAPVVDPHTGSVVMVVAIDVLAADWRDSLKAEQRRPLYIAGVLLLVAAATLIMRRRVLRISAGRMQLRRLLMVPVVVIMFLSVALYLFYGHREFNRLQHQAMTGLRDQFRDRFNQEMSLKRETLRAQARYIAGDAKVCRALQSRDRAALAEYSGPLFESLRRDIGLTHLNFIGSDFTLVYRAHSPEFFGDRINRRILAAVHETDQDAWGFESGFVGGLTYRYMRPVRCAGSFVGYVELGFESEQRAERLARDMGIELLVVADKRYVSREAFERGRSMFGFTGEWNDFGGAVILQSTLPDVPAMVRSLLAENTDRLNDSVALGSHNDRRFMYGSHAVSDSAGRPLGWFVLVRNITADSRYFMYTIAFIVLLTVGMLGCIALLLWSLTGTAEQQLNDAFARIQESESLFRALFDNALSGVAIHQSIEDERGDIVDFVYLDVNKGFERHTGMSSTDVVGKRASEVFPFIRESQLLQVYAAVVRTGKSANFGQFVEPLQRFFNINAFQLGPGRFATVFQDITERKEMEKALIRELDEHRRIEAELISSRNILDEAQHIARIGMWVFDVTTQKFTWSDEAYRILGLEPGTSLSFTEFSAMVHPDDYEMLAHKWATVAGSEVAMESDYRIIRPDGELRYIHECVMHRCGEDGYVVQSVALMQDITERTLSGEKMRQLSQAVEQSPALVVITDTAGNIQYVNSRFVELTGYAAEDVIGQNPRILKSGETTPEVYAEMWRTIRGGGIWRGEFHNKKRSGELYWEGAMIAPIRDTQGCITHFLAIKEDITERKRVEEDLLGANSNLEQAIARANDMAVQAELANMSKSEFLANMSHEIRTPMNGVIGMTGLLLDSALTAEQRQYADIVRSCGESLLALINEILDLSKIESGKLDLEVLDFDVRATMEDTAELLSVKAAEKGLELVCMLDPDVPVLLRGDPGRLRQLFMNLGGNAVKFTERGSVTLRAMLEKEDDDRATVRFTVVDTGIGIPQDKQQLIFNPFTQADGSTTRKYGGTGLGLAISKKLVELMDGSIGLESRPGQGSTFWFSAVFEKQPPGRLTEPPPMVDLTGVRVLVVDDYATNRLLVTTLLHGWGCRFAEAADAATALERLHGAAVQNDPYRIALLDMHMPGMNGDELGRRIKQCPDIAQTHLIMMTSLGQRGDAARFQAEGFEGYLHKPLRQMQLRDCMAMVLGKAQTRQGDTDPLVTRHTISEARRQRVRILVVEDNATNQIVALKILEKLGYNADAVADGAEALASLQSIPYDLVFMDCQMPDMDGFEATRRIRSKQSGVLNSSVPVIAMTARAMLGDRDKCLEAGMDDYLSKPVDPAAMAVVLERWLGDGTATEAPVALEKSAVLSVFDRSAFEGRLMGDEDIMKLVIEKFMSDFPEQLDLLDAFAAAGDSAGAWQLGHKINGSAANLSAEALRVVAFEIEKAGKGGDIERVRLLVPELRGLFAELHEVLQCDGLSVA